MVEPYIPDMVQRYIPDMVEALQTRYGGSARYRSASYPIWCTRYIPNMVQRYIPRMVEALHYVRVCVA
jgi:hypothetical protein